MAKGKKTGGRVKGSKGKYAKQWESFAAYCFSGGLKKYQEEMDKLSGKDYVTAFNNTLEFHAPKLARVETKDTSENKKPTVTIVMVGKGE